MDAPNPTLYAAKLPSDQERTSPTDGTTSAAQRGVYHHLDAAFAIAGREPDFRKWGPMIDALAPEVQAEVRPWLREEARKRICYAKYRRAHPAERAAA